MRIRNLVAAVMAAAALLAVAPAIASARKPCRVSINLSPHLIETGESVAIFGRLACRPHRGAARRVVKLLGHPADASGFGVIQSTTTDARGFYSFVTAGVQTNSSFYVRSRGARSGLRAVQVLAHVTINGPADDSQLFTGAPNKVTFTGTVTPAEEGALVVLQRQNAVGGNEWHRIDLGRVGPGGSYSITHAFAVPGDANIRVLVRSQRRTVPSPSEVLTYQISQAQNPHLTINASADPIAFGQSVTITGSAPGLALQPLTLLAHTAAQAAFAPVAEVKTDATGSYSFPAQSPVANTFYEVRGGGRLSAVLFEGVKDVLSAAVSPGTIRAGMSLTFSGTVAPDHSGHVIYLQRQNRTGDGFHIAEVGVVGPGSTYSLVYTVYDPGTNVFRVKIPGGPENEGAVSQPFTILVTPAPAPALRPESPSNSTLPPEGEV